MTDRKSKTIVTIQKFGVFRLDSIIGMSEPFPLDETSTLYGMEFYLSSGHTAVLRDQYPKFLFAVRRILANHMLLEENYLLPVSMNPENFVLTIRRAAYDPETAEVME